MAAAIDLHACIDAPLELVAGAAAALVPTGIAVHMADPGMAALVLPRSGLGHRKGLVLGNLIGLIDADYTGPVLVSAWNRLAPGSGAIVLTPGRAFCADGVRADLRPRFQLVGVFTLLSGRGAGGFGSTGSAHVPGYWRNRLRACHVHNRAKLERIELVRSNTCCYKISVT